MTMLLQRPVTFTSFGAPSGFVNSFGSFFRCGTEIPYDISEWLEPLSGEHRFRFVSALFYFGFVLSFVSFVPNSIKLFVNIMTD